MKKSEKAIITICHQKVINFWLSKASSHLETDVLKFSIICPICQGRQEGEWKANSNHCFTFNGCLSLKEGTCILVALLSPPHPIGCQLVSHEHLLLSEKGTCGIPTAPRHLILHSAHSFIHSTNINSIHISKIVCNLLRIQSKTKHYLSLEKLRSRERRQVTYDNSTCNTAMTHQKTVSKPNRE